MFQWIHALVRLRSCDDAELDEEVRTHLAMERQRRIDGGEAPDVAQAGALKDFGSVLRVKEATREMWRWSWMERLGQDLRFGWRMLARNPGYAAAAILSLGLGIGANTAIFSVVSGVLLRPLPFDRPEDLVEVRELEERSDTPGAVSRANFQEWRAASQSMSGFAVYSNSSMNLQSVDGAEQVQIVHTEPGLFSLLGTAAWMGRTFDAKDGERVAVAAYNWWKNRMGGDPSAVGHSLILDGQTFTVIGVMPEDFRFPYGPAAAEGLWLPRRIGTGGGRLTVLGRLKPGVPLLAAQEELARMNASGPNPERRPQLTYLTDAISAPVRQSLLVLLGAVGMVLLIACANVANLLLAHTASRAREIAIRDALGATRLRQMGQFLVEALLLSCGAGIVGLALGLWGSKLLVALAATQLPRASEIGMDWRVFVFLLATCLITAVAFGVLPAMSGSGATTQSSALRTRSVRAGLRDLLVVGEIGGAFVLLVGAGLLLQTFLNLQRTDAGVQSENVLTAHVVISGAKESLALAEHVSAIPGVRAAGLISLLPLQHSGWDAWFSIKGRSDVLRTELRYVTPDYFRAMGVPLRKGRVFSDADTPQSQQVILVNETLARRYFGDEDPIGRATDRGVIVGVVGDVRQSALGTPAIPEIFYTVNQNFAQIGRYGSTLVVSGNVPAQSLIASVRSAVQTVSPGKAIFQVATMEQVIDESLTKERLYTWLLLLFAGIGTLLTLGGTYSVVSYLVALKTVEFGIRMALGAGKREVLLSVMKRGAVFAVSGVGLGLAGSLALTRVLQGFLYGVAPTDPSTLALVALVLVVVAMAACVLPARRATRIDPAVALRAN